MVGFHFNHAGEDGEEVEICLVGGKEAVVVELLVGEVVLDGGDEVLFGSHETK